MKTKSHLVLISFVSMVALISTPGPVLGGDYGAEPGYSDPGIQYGQPKDRSTDEPLDKKGAEILLKELLDSGRNPNLKVGRVEDKGVYYEAEIVTQDSELLVDRVTVNKVTGKVRPAY